MMNGIFGKVSELKNDFRIGVDFDNIVTELEDYNDDDIVYLDDMGNVHLYECDDYKKMKLLTIKEVLKEFDVYDDTLGACEDIYNGFIDNSLRRNDGTLVDRWKILTKIDEVIERRENNV